MRHQETHQHDHFFMGLFGQGFVALLFGVIIITGGLIYFPADTLGPFIEHLQMYAGKLY